MSRSRGIFNQASNYEPQIAAPLDARTVVEFKSDLTNSTTWTLASGTPYLFNGLLVCVTNDPDVSLDGLYILIDADNYTSEISWRKIADIRDIETLNERIDQISAGGGGAIQVEARGNLPNVGSEGGVYFVKNENATYRWDETARRYYCVGRDYQEIQVISGGSAADEK